MVSLLPLYKGGSDLSSKKEQWKGHRISKEQKISIDDIFIANCICSVIRPKKAPSSIIWKHE
jgi:hypothetical protein